MNYIFIIICLLLLIVFIVSIYFYITSKSKARKCGNSIFKNKYKRPLCGGVIYEKENSFNKTK